jgi:hypothetical protein
MRIFALKVLMEKKDLGINPDPFRDVSKTMPRNCPCKKS